LTQPGRNSHYDKNVAGPAWDDEVASEHADANLARLAVEISSASNESRSLPTANLARTWHREMLDGVEIRDPDGVEIRENAYRGGFRGDAHPALIDYEVTVGGLSTTRACDVSSEIRQIMIELERRVSDLDDLDAQADPTILIPDFVEEVLDTAAWLHCEWVRAHPFVNGNGRTARMWVLWLSGRYGLPQLLPLRPRPDMGYNAASQLGVTGDHNLLLQYLLYRYNTAPHLMYNRR
jgi:fido (protein-threonine AMPylation protein)